MKEIKLTGKYADGRVALVSDEDFERVMTRKWLYWPPYGRTQETVSAKIAGKRVKLHRFILQVVDPNIHVDHINGNRLDNTRDNLRLASLVENSRNRGPQRNNKLGFKGVRKLKQKAKNPFTAHINVNKKQIFLGGFASAEEAAKAYDVKAKELFGNFAVLNFPEENT